MKNDRSAIKEFYSVCDYKVFKIDKMKKLLGLLFDHI